MTSTYELMVVLVPSLTADQQKKILTALGKTVGVVGGKVMSSEVWGKRELSYPIEKQTEAIYAVLQVKLPAEGPAGLEKELLINEQVLRQLLVQKKGN